MKVGAALEPIVVKLSHPFDSLEFTQERVGQQLVAITDIGNFDRVVDIRNDRQSLPRQKMSVTVDRFDLREFRFDLKVQRSPATGINDRICLNLLIRQSDPLSKMAVPLVLAM